MNNLLLNSAFSFCLFALAGITVAHQEEEHSDKGVTNLETKSSNSSFNPFPVELGGSFNLIDHNGVERSEQDFPRKYLLVFFGYAHCKSICTVGLRRMGEAVDALDDAGKTIQPVMITVDPANDTLEVMKQALPEIHPRLLGLTGSADALAQAYDAYKIKPGKVGPDSEGDMVINHTSYIYLMSPNGDFLTLIPPIIGGERMGEIISSYMSTNTS